MTQPLNKSADDGAATVNSRAASSGQDSKEFLSFEGNAGRDARDNDDHNALDQYRMADATGTVKGSGPAGAQSEGGKSVGERPPECDSLARFGFPEGLDIFDPDDEESSADVGCAEKTTESGGKIASKPHSPEDSRVAKASSETKGGNDAFPKTKGDDKEMSATKDAGKGPSLDGMAQWFEDNFDNLDKDKDGVISKTELDKALLDPKLATEDGAVYLATANDKTYGWAEHFGSKSDGGENPKAGISRDSLTKMREAAKTQESTENREKLGISKLDNDKHNNIDQNGDNCITRAELDEALKKDHWTTEQRENLESLKKNFSEVAKTTDDSVPATFSEDAGIPGFDYVSGLKEEFVSPLDMQKYSSDEAKFVNGLKESISDNVENRESKFPIDQHGLDSCFLLAPLEALEKEQPGAMDKMIKDNGDGTVTVTFPGDPEKPVTIAKPTQGEQAEFTNGKAGIIEKAFAEYVSKLPEEEQKKYMEHPVEGKPTLIQHQLDGGGFTDSAMSLLTGTEAARQPVKPMSEQQIIDSLTAATESHQLITIGTNLYAGGEGSGISPAHAYSASFDPKTNMITLTNPYKPGSLDPAEPTGPDGSPVDGKSDGSFTLTIEQFKQYTDHLYIGRTKTN